MESTRTAYFDCFGMILDYASSILMSLLTCLKVPQAEQKYDLRAFTTLQLSGFDIVR